MNPPRDGLAFAALRLLLPAGLALTATLARAQCTSTTWSTQFGTTATGLSSTATCMAVYDPDGPGPLPAELYAGGYFQTAGGIAARGIAKWNGQAWSALGTGLTGTSIGVTALTVFDADGPGPGLPVLVVAGGFTAAGGVPASHIASWNGSQWSAVGTGFGFGIANCMIQFDADGPGPELPKLWLGGDPYFNGTPTTVALWDGQSWAPQPFTSVPQTFEVYDEDDAGPAIPSLFMATAYPGGVLKWDGSQWIAVGGGLTRSGNYLGRALCVVDEDGPGPARPVLLAGGNYSFAGGSPANSIARWNGTSWSALGTGIGTGNSAEVWDIASVDYTRGTGAPTIYACAADFTTGVFRWNPATQSWPNIGVVQLFSPMFQHALASYDAGTGVPSLYFAGIFQEVNSIPSNFIARLACEPCYANCDGTTSTPILTANDFQCFLNHFAAANPYANCDGSTTLPTLTANDFQCYLNQYAAGCS